MPSRSHPIHRAPRVPRSEAAAGGRLCDHCVGKCCRYISVPIKTPRTWDDFDEVRWFLAHGQTVVYLEKDVWHLLVLARCRYLTATNRCAIYHDRPAICDDYSSDDCEYDSDWTFETVFEAPEQVQEYAEAVLPPRPPRRKPKPSAPAPRDLVALPPPPLSGSKR